MSVAYNILLKLQFYVSNIVDHSLDFIYDVPTIKLLKFIKFYNISLCPRIYTNIAMQHINVYMLQCDVLLKSKFYYVFRFIHLFQSFFVTIS